MFAYHIHVLYLLTTEGATGILSSIGSTKLKANGSKTFQIRIIVLDGIPL